MLLVSAVVLAFIWAATEWTAWQLGFQPQLGHPWFELFGWPVYQPPAFFWWWFAYDAYARDIFVEGAYIAASGGIAAVVVAVAMSVWRAREVKKVTTYGSARWAETREVRRAGLLQRRRRAARPLARRLSSPRRTRACAVLRADPKRQGRRPRRADAADLAGLGDRPRHQGRELDTDRRLARRVSGACCCSIRPMPTAPPTTRCSKCAAANGRCATSRTSPMCWSIPKGALERRNHWEKTSHSLLVGDDPARALRRAGQDARRRRQFPVRSEAADRDDAARDDDDAASRRSAACIRSSPAPRASF